MSESEWLGINGCRHGCIDDKMKSTRRKIAPSMKIAVALRHLDKKRNHTSSFDNIALSIPHICIVHCTTLFSLHRQSYCMYNAPPCSRRCAKNATLDQLGNRKADTDGDETRTSAYMDVTAGLVAAQPKMVGYAVSLWLPRHLGFDSYHRLACYRRCRAVPLRSG